MTPDQVLSHIAGEEKVSLPVATIIKDLKIPPGDHAALAALERNLSVLRDAGDICRWTLKGKDVVTLSSIAAYRFRLKLNQSSTKWMDHGTPDRRDRNDRVSPRTTEDGAQVLCESDMTEESPGSLDGIVDWRGHAEDDPDFGRSRILAEETSLGLVRPTLPLVGIRPWTPENWERVPDSHLCDPLDDPRRAVEPGAKPARRMKPEKLREARSGEPCPVCNGRPLRKMLGLVTRKAGANRAARPPELVDGGEHCCRCGRDWQDSRWPRVFRIGATDGNGKASQ